MFLSRYKIGHSIAVYFMKRIHFDASIWAKVPSLVGEFAPLAALSSSYPLSRFDFTRQVAQA
jgi:hypothetical protein